MNISKNVIMLGNNLKNNKTFFIMQNIDLKHKKVLLNINKESDSNNFEELNIERISDKNYRMYCKLHEFIFNSKILDCLDWTEYRSEVKLSESDIISEINYLGIHFRDKDSLYYIGSVGDDSESLYINTLEKFILFHMSDTQTSKNIFEFNTVEFSRYSSLIICHELFGHLAEGDVGLDRVFTEGLQVTDFPSSDYGIDYSIDDNGNRGKSVDLINCDLGVSTSNIFFGVDKHGKLNSQVRHRNIVVKTENSCCIKDGLSSCLHINYAGISTSGKYLNLIIPFENNSYRITIPLDEIIKVFSTGSCQYSNVMYCWKRGVPHLVYLRSPRLAMVLKRTLSSYIRKRSK
ncbi:MAG: hypothetical protein Q4Q17_01670 [Tissierellia bacterium]|nr:hypothetical protein [Tissierellia bacterium]